MKIAIIGNLLSGKTTFINKLREKGIKVFSAEEFGKKLFSPQGEGYRRVSEVLGTQFVNEDGLDQNAIFQAAFTNPRIQEQLKEIVPELMKNEIEKYDNLVIEVDGRIPLPKIDHKVMITVDNEVLMNRMKSKMVKVPEEELQRIIERWDNNIEVDMKINSTNGISDQDIDLFIEKFY